MPEEGLPDGWRTYRLGDICEKPQYGWTTSACRTSGGLKLLRTTDISTGNINWDEVPSCENDPPDPGKYTLAPGDIVISRAGSVGVSHIIGDCPAAVFASYLIRFRPLAGFDSRYIHYFLLSPSYWDAISGTTTGITIPNVNASKLREIEIPVPPLPEQKRIVAKLDELMAEIKAAKAHLARAKEILTRFRQSVLNAAVTGKLTEEWRGRQANLKPAREAIRDALQHREQFWPQDLRFHKPLDLPDQSGDNLPEGWEWTCTDQIAACSLGKMLDQTKHRTGVPLPYLRNENVQWDRIETDDISEMFFKENETSRYLVEKGDLLICEGGEPGRCAIWDGSISPMMYQKALHRVRMLSGTPARWVLYCLSHDAATGHLEKYFTGSGIKHFTGRALAEYILRFPPPKEQVEIIGRVESLFAGVSLIEERCNVALAATDRQSTSLLEHAFAGIL